jgi:surfactin synthase thioesterase subunit
MNNRSDSNRWVLIPKPLPDARLRLFCLPYAGGTPGAYRSWPDMLTPDIEVAFIQLPGHGPRYREALLTRISTARPLLADGLADYLDLPFALFGQSLGALLAFELARELRHRGQPGPVHLFVSARPAPQLPNDWSIIHMLADKLMIKEVQRRYGGIPQAIMADEEMLRLFLPILRADLELLETYEYRPQAPLDCDITAYGGYQDWAVTDAQLECWGEQTLGQFSQQMFPGDHFFVQNTTSFVRAFSSALASIGLQV